MISFYIIDMGTPSFVMASYCASTTTKAVLRSYAVRRLRPSPITVIDAVLATCAAYPDFSHVESGSGPSRRDYMATDIVGASNPVREVITEALDLFGGDTSVAFLLSLGTGHPGAIPIPADGGVDPYQIMRRRLNDCEKTAQEIERQIGPVGIYFRFSVEQGMQGSLADQAAGPGWLPAQAEAYLSDVGTSSRIDRLIGNFDAASRYITLDQLGMFSPSCSRMRLSH